MSYLDKLFLFSVRNLSDSEKLFSINSFPWLNIFSFEFFLELSFLSTFIKVAESPPFHLYQRVILSDPAKLVSSVSGSIEYILNSRIPSLSTSAILLSAYTDIKEILFSFNILSSFPSFNINP